MSRLRAIWLVGRREILERGRSRAFILSLVLTQLLIVGAFVLPMILGGDRDLLKLGVVEPAPAGLEAALTVAASPFGATVALTPYADETAGRTALIAKEVAALLVVPADLAKPGTLLVRDRAEDRLRAVVASAIVGLRQASFLEGRGVSPAELVAVALPPSVEALDPQNETDEAAFFLANVGVVLLFMSIFSFGAWVLTGVVEEKQSRVVEVVLSTVRPRDLLMGKVFGIGVLGLAQLVVFLATGLVLLRFTDSIELPPTTAETAVQMVGWFVLGYALYATVFGALGALASRMEEAQNATMPVTIVAITCYLAALLVVPDEPTGPVARVLTFVPPAAPMVVPLRTAFGAIEPWEVLLAVALTLAAIYALFVIGGRVYQGAVLQTAGRLRLRDAWRAGER
jgi:ABC-2 type transport system permease protein